MDKSYRPGDIVTWDLGRGLVHIGIISDRKLDDKTPLVIHNIGSGTQENNILFQYKITGHYRIKEKKKLAKQLKILNLYL